MTNHHTNPWHSDYLDDELSSEKKTEIKAHLEICAECRDDMEKLRRLRSALRSIEAPDPGREYFADLTERIAARTVSSATDQRVAKYVSSRTDILKTLIRLAAVITLLFGSFYVSNLKQEKEGVRWSNTISKGNYVQSDSSQSLNYPNPVPGKITPADSTHKTHEDSLGVSHRK